MKKNVKRYITLGVIGVVFLVLPLINSKPFFLHIFIMFFLYSLLASSWNIIGGFAGQLSFGHALYFGIGAYVSTFLFVHFNISPWFGLLVAVLLAASIGAIAGLTFFRLKGHYFAIGTIGLLEAVAALFN